MIRSKSFLTKGLSSSALLALTSVLTFAFFAPGDLDTSFDMDGLVTLDAAGSQDSARGIAIQADGKIVLAGGAGATIQDIGIARLNADGSPDTTFDGDGRVLTNLGGNDRATALVLQADGKMVLAASTDAAGNNDFAVVRFNSNGGLDPTFDSDGIVTTRLSTTEDDAATAIALQADGKIVLGGSVGNSDFGLARYHTNGTLDTTFDSDGMVITNLGAVDFLQGLAIQADGKIIAAGRVIDGATADVAVVRYNSNGSLDTTFDTDGIVRTNFSGGMDQGFAVALQNDGKIVVAGSSPLDIAVVRYNTNGSLDTSFDSDGVVTTSFTASLDLASSVLVQPDGKIVVGGSTQVPGGFNFAAVRYNPSGSLDTSFSSDGLQSISFGAGTSSNGTAITLLPSGSILFAGTVNTGSGLDFGVAKLEAGTVPVELMQFAIE